MKNTIPLIVAVVLGLLAVFAVSRTIAKNGSSQHGKEVSVLVANGNLKSGSVISPENCRSSRVPLVYLPKQHVLEDQKSSVVGQVLTRSIAAGDYIQWDDLGQTSSLGESVGDGEWAVPVTFKNTALVKMLKSGDEIAVVGMFRISVEKESNDPNVDKKREVEEKTVTMVLYPQVRIMGMASNGTVLLSLPPQQALVAIAAQEQADLYAVLRRPHDEKSMNRKIGVFDGSAFVKMLEGCPEITIPDQPSNKVQ